MIAWVRPVIRWLAAFGQLDQAWTAVFSVRELVGEAAFQAAINGSVPVTFQFVLPVARLESHAFTRVRGMPLFAECGTLTGPMRARVALPKRATVRRPKVAAEVRPRAGELEDYSLNQEDLPPCYFGRVQAQNAPRAPETVGLISLTNASPISDATAAPEFQKWTLELAPFAAVDLKTCRDLHLELNLLGKDDSIVTSEFGASDAERIYFLSQDSFESGHTSLESLESSERGSKIDLDVLPCSHRL